MEHAVTSKVLTSRDLIKYRTNRPRTGQPESGHQSLEDLYLVSNKQVLSWRTYTWSAGCVLSWRTYTWSATDVYYHGGLIPGQQWMCIIMEDLYLVSNGHVLSWRTYTWSAKMEHVLSGGLIPGQQDTDVYYHGGLIPGQQQMCIIMEDLYLVSNGCVLSWRTYTWSATDVYYHGGLIPGQQRMCIIMEDLYLVSNRHVLPRSVVLPLQQR